MKILFLVFLALFLYTGCSTNTYNISNNSMNLYLKDKRKVLININILKSIRKNQYDRKVLDGYTLNIQESNFGKLYIEHINLLDKYTWIGFPRALLTDLISKKLNLDSMELINTVDVKNYEFTTFKINNHCTINIIFIWYDNQSTFIIDYDGLLTNELKERFGQTPITLNTKRCNLNFQDSLTRSNIIEHYFELYNIEE